jgi:hypothetical protein
MSDLFSPAGYEFARQVADLDPAHDLIHLTKLVETARRVVRGQGVDTPEEPPQ